MTTLKSRKVVIVVEVETTRKLADIKKDAKAGTILDDVKQVQVNVVKK